MITAPVAHEVDPRIAAFCSQDAAEVFASIVQPQSIWKPDPLDVEQIHQEAREKFSKLYHRALDPKINSGSVLLIQGVAGSGKTHLMRAFRQHVHEQEGYCGYLQMVSQSQHYYRYVLGNLIDSLGNPYLVQSAQSSTGLARLARGLLDLLLQNQMIDQSEAQTFCDEHQLRTTIVEQANRLADLATQIPSLKEVPLDLLRAILFLLPSDAPIHQRIIKWLRCEELTPYDRALIGELASQTDDSSPLRTIGGLAKLMVAIHQAPLVLLIDQLEEAFDSSIDPKEAGRRFQLAIEAVVNIAGMIPSCVVVVSCLKDYYDVARQYLPGPKLDRLEHDKPVLLKAERSLEEITALLGKRLAFLLSEKGVSIDSSNELFPFTINDFRAIENFNTRKVLNWFREHHQNCILADRWISPTPVAEEAVAKPSSPRKEADLELTASWNDFLSSFPTPTELTDDQEADLISQTLVATRGELPSDLYVGCSVSERFVEASINLPNNQVDKLLIAPCEKKVQGNGFSKQIQELAKRAGEIPAVVVRSTDYPKAKTQASEHVMNLIAPRGKGRRVSVEMGDWRAMQAFREFANQNSMDARFSVWQDSVKPLTSLPSVRSILDLDQLLIKFSKEVKAKPRIDPPFPPVGIAKQEALSQAIEQVQPSTKPLSTSLIIGKTRGIGENNITIEPLELTRHMSFVGGPGSGKTTAALSLIEQLLARGIPAVLIDRKGDLSRYADPSAWISAPNDPRKQERFSLYQQLDIALFTPGLSEGRPLGLQVVPNDLHLSAKDERDRIAAFTAASLWSMMGKKMKSQDPQLAILIKAIAVLGSMSEESSSLDQLRRLIQDQDMLLLQELDGFDGKHFTKLAEELQTFKAIRSNLYEANEKLDIDLLLGKKAFAVPGKTRLTILNLQGLADDTAMEFWVTQLLVALSRWKTKNPCDQLQAVFLFDEADKYVPAISQPPTKGPMDSLLRQIRSAGVGLFLSTQNPGDFDYKCRDLIRNWLVGLVKEKNSHDKLKPILEHGRGNVLGQLSSQKQGQFYFAREQDVVPVTTQPSLIETKQVAHEKIVELARSKKR